MNWDRIEANWQHFGIDVKHRWKKLTNNELDGIAGQRDLLSKTIQSVYVMSAPTVELQIEDWQRSLRELDHTDARLVKTGFAEGA